MATPFSYKETKTTTMKIIGMVDTDEMTVEVEGEIKNLATLLSPFNGAVVEISAKVKDETDLAEPQE